MLIVLGAPCLSEHICINAGSMSPSSVIACPLLCPVLGPAPQTEHYAASWEAYQARLSSFQSHRAQSKGLDHAFLLFSTQLPHFFRIIIELPSVWNGVLLLLLTWTSNLWCVLKSAWIKEIGTSKLSTGCPEKREPLKIARLCCNELL